jgi:tryptophanyl-tRNA synthetase
MSKSYANTIALRDDTDTIASKLRTMPTDPARVRRTDPGDPAKCPVWQFHEVYSDDDTRDWVQQGCRNASIGCVECKQPVIDAVLAELKPMQERAKEYEEDVSTVKAIIEEGNEAAREVARDTLEDVRKAMGIAYL